MLIAPEGVMSSKAFFMLSSVVSVMVVIVLSPPGRYPRL